MEYAVELALRAEFDLEGLYMDKNVAESKAALRWILGLERRIESLALLPRRGRIIPESKELGIQLRQILYGNKPHIYRIIYQIEEDARKVLVLTVWSGARPPITLADLW